MPDVRKSLETLHSEWYECERCSLGPLRKEMGGQFVFGEGPTGMVMVVGEGPGVEEAKSGFPFVGKSGTLLREALTKCGIEEQTYITNIVCCRSCVPVLDEQGVQRVNRDGPAYHDEPPTALQIQACRERLLEEIYLVDPVVIITLGGVATSALAQRPVAISKERGEPFQAEVSGNSYVPVLTDKKKQWIRKSKGELHMPVELFPVRYLVVPTIHPAYVLRNFADRGPHSALSQFVDDIKLASGIYHRYLSEVRYGA